MKCLVLALILFLSSTAAQAAETLTFGNRVLSTGDSIGRVYELLGQPDNKVELENKFGDRLVYYRNGKTIQIVIRGGTVASIYEGT